MTHPKGLLRDISIVGAIIIAAVFLLPITTALFARIDLWNGEGVLLRLAETLLQDSLPHAIVGIGLGAIAIRLLLGKHISLILAPALGVVMFQVVYFTAGPSRYPWGHSLLMDAILLSDWGVLIAASAAGASLVKKYLNKKDRLDSPLPPPPSR